MTLRRRFKCAAVCVKPIRNTCRSYVHGIDCLLNVAALAKLGGEFTNTHVRD